MSSRDLLMSTSPTVLERRSSSEARGLTLTLLFTKSSSISLGVPVHQSIRHWFEAELESWSNQMCPYVVLHSTGEQARPGWIGRCLQPTRQRLALELLRAGLPGCSLEELSVVVFRVCRLQSSC